MSRCAVFLALAASVGLSFAKTSAEEPHLEFVSGLRQRGMSDLAVAYLERLSANPPPSLAAVMPLELAKARLDLASQEGDSKKRTKQFEEARSAFEKFLATNPNHPRAADARLDLARLVAMQAKHLLAQANRQESVAARKDLMAQARPLFGEAAGKLKDAARAIDAKLRQLDSATTDEDKAAKVALARARLQAQLEEAINLINQSNTMTDSKENKARIAVINQAKDLLTKLSVQDAESPYTWLGKLWLGRLAEEIEDKRVAIKRYIDLAKETSPAAEEAARTAAYYLLRLQMEEPAPDRNAQMKQAIAGCEEWLKKHRSAIRTSEGQGVRYLLANLLEDQAKPGIARPQQPNQPIRINSITRQALDRAEKMYKELAETEGEFTEKARNRRAGVLVVLMAERAQDVTRLNNFEECYLAAQVEAYEITQGKKSDEEKAKRLSKIVGALKRGLSLASRGDSPRDIADARVMLAYAYLAGGEVYHAAILGEHLAHERLPGNRGAEAAAYGLQAYAGVLEQSRRRNASADEIKSDQRRLRGLAAYMEKTWPNEPATDIARHQLGSFLLDDHNYPDAVAMLGRIASSYPGLAHARYQEGAAAQKAQLVASLPAERKKQILDQAIADLERVPYPAPGASEETTLAVCMAKLQLGNLLLLAEHADGANYTRAETVAKRLAALMPDLSLDDSAAPQVAAETTKLQLAANCGKVLQLLKADKFAEAQQLLAPMVTSIEANAEKKEIHEPLREAQRQVVLLALRSAILEDNAADADKAMTLLRKITPVTGAGSANDRLLGLMVSLRREAALLKEKGENAKRERLDGGLLSFVDELAKGVKITPDVRLFLASAYSSLDKHKKAADLLKDYPAPASPDGEETKRYHAIRVALMREYRLAGDHQQALFVLNDAMKSWGKTNLDVQRERVFLLEDAGNIVAAHRATREMQDALKKHWTDYERARADEKAADEAERQAKTDEERTKAQQEKGEATVRKANALPFREAYWEFYFYEIRLVLKNDLKKAKDPADKERRLTAIAAAIKRLEDGQEDFGGKGLREKYRELVEGEPVLKAKYLEAQGKRLFEADNRQSH